MGFLHNLKLRLSPPKISDPDLGVLVFKFLPNTPEKSYWVCEWSFAKTGTVITIVLPGGEEGPIPETRAFILTLPGHFEQILASLRPELEKVFKTWLKKELPQDIFSVLELGGFGVENARTHPIEWYIEFMTTGEKWLGITVSFVGDTPKTADVEI